MATLLIIIGVLGTIRKNEKRLKELKIANIIEEITENCKAGAENSMRVAMT